MNLKFPWSWTLGWKNNATRNLSSLYFSSWFRSFWLRSTLLFLRASYLQTWHGHCSKKFTRAASLNFKCSHFLKKKSEFTRPFGGKKKKRKRKVTFLHFGFSGTFMALWAAMLWMDRKFSGSLFFLYMNENAWSIDLCPSLCLQVTVMMKEWEGKSTSDHLRAHWFWTREYSHVQPLFSVICYCILQKYCIWIF